MDKVYRNTKLKGVISRDKALELLNGDLVKIIHYRKHDIIISIDDMYNIDIDLYDTENQESIGGDFEEI